MTPKLTSYLLPSFIQRRYTAKFVVSILFVVLAIGIVGYVGYAQVNTTIEDSRQDTLRSSAEMQADSLDEWSQLMEQQSRAIGNLENVANGDGEAITSYEAHLDDYVAIHVIDFSNDTVVFSTVDTIEGNDFESVDDPWASESLQEEFFGGTMWMSEGSYESNALSGTQAIAFATPTSTNSERVVVIDAAIQTRIDQLTQQHSTQSTDIVNADYQYVLSQNSETADGTIDDQNQREAIDAALETRNVQFTSNGGELRAYAPVNGPGTADDWVAVTSIPKSDAYVVRDTVGQSVLMILAVAFLSLGIMGFVLGRQTVTPLRRLQSKAQSMEEGKLDVDLETGRKDEIGQLYSAFDDMRRSLREQIQEAQSAREEAEAERERIQRINMELESTADDYSTVMQQAADGDLTARMETSTDNDAMAAIAEEYNEMLAEIEETVEGLNAFAAEVATASEQVTASSEEVRSASEQISDSVQEISAGAERQNDSLQTVNQEMSDLSTTTEEIAASSNEVADIAEQTAETGRAGRDAAQAAIASMREIEDESSRAVEEIAQLEQEVSQIDELIERIQEISDQTNMLALNANIEASRTTGGEEDGGFGVVAQEVKELSQDAKDAAEEIEHRLESIREQTQRSAEEVEQTSEDVDEASTQVANAVEALEEIAEYAGETNTGVQEISAATEEQAATTEEVVAMVDEAATISEETTAESESVAAAAEEQTTALTEVSSSASDLSEQAARLSEALDRFDTDAEVEGAETRMLEGEALEGTGEGEEPAGEADDDGVDDDVDAFDHDVAVEDFGADAATEPEGGADEPAASPAAEPADEARGDEDVGTATDQTDEATDQTGEDVFDFGQAERSDAGSDPGEDDGAGDDSADVAEGALTDVSGVGDAKAEALRAAGYETVADLRAATQAQLAQVEGIGDALAVEIKEAVGHE
ncbi:methyl-accepting chemotaxis sensory transducer [Salinarchaeum sp. Harcht-Bsk1]|uniref:methyl-accepting chemotaxis protein n=1 Tax=Salinarchaeum sp. Harcht-Bsk1 TaxID=1333523 RepID=UPI0003422DD9|nr:methyl-accepting chemotaxis protein [Salinarchaeum sp. Harcht-Bsk1]AGN01126.1 methyl-accepting chemotaxis sensory transducer [Salinarchaeum sp. Harcht-Bsk1]